MSDVRCAVCGVRCHVSYEVCVCDVQYSVQCSVFSVVRCHVSCEVYSVRCCEVYSVQCAVL